MNTKIYMKMIDFRRGYSITLCSNIEWGPGEKFTLKSDATYGHDKIMLLLKYYKVFFSMFICYFMFFSIIDLDTAVNDFESCLHDEYDRISFTDVDSVTRRFLLRSQMRKS